MKYIMLTGHRKSGTTLLHKLFDGHPEVNIYPVDVTLLYAYYPYWLELPTLEEKKERIEAVIKKSTQSIDGLQISKAINKFKPEEFISCLWAHATPADLVSPGSIIRALAIAYCDYAELDPDLPFLFKETSQIINAESMIEEGIDLTVIQIVRDPRDNYAAIKSGSSYYSEMGEMSLESLASLVNRARLDLELATLYTDQNKSWFKAIKFEDITRSPEDVMAEASVFLGISFCSTLVAPTLLGAMYSGNSHEGKKFSGVSRDNVGKWQNRITSFESAVIESWMKSAMEGWGYIPEASIATRVKAISEFYAWYNSRYFYYDSISVQ